MGIIRRQYKVRCYSREGVLKDHVADTREALIEQIKTLGVCKGDEEKLIARIREEEREFVNNLNNNE